MSRDPLVGRIFGEPAAAPVGDVDVADLLTTPGHTVVTDDLAAAPPRTRRV